MTAGSVFDVLTVDRGRVRWEEHLGALTPVERHAGIAYKRDDWFAPLGYGGINGTKLRQLVYLFDRYCRQGSGEGVVTGASVMSPQVSMTALVARHFGMEALVVLGATRFGSAVKHENVAIAHAAGAEFAFTPVAYNPQLQRAVVDIAARPEHAGWYRLHYGITTPDDATDQAIAEFHAVSARQTANLPADTRTVMMTAGSCNSCASVLYGLALARPPALERVVLIGVGPTRLAWLRARLAAVERATGMRILDLFRPEFVDHRDDEWPERGPVALEHHDLHSTKWVSYADRMPWRQDGIDFHPTYEGKLMTFFNRHPERFGWRDDGGLVVWIVGSAPTGAAMAGVL